MLTDMFGDGIVVTPDPTATFPVSAMALPLPAGAASAAAQATILAAVQALATILGQPLTISDGGGSVTVDMVSAPLPAGAATSAKQDAAVTTLTSILAALGSALTVSVNNSSLAITAAALPLPTGAATSAKQDVQHADLASILTAVTTPALPTGGATAAKQDTLHADLAQIHTDLGLTPTATGQTSELAKLDVLHADLAKGQQAMATSLSVVVASDQSALPTSTPDLYIIGQSAQTATVNNILTVTAGTNATDLAGYHSASIQVVSTGTGGTYIFEGSNDNASWQAVPVWNQAVLTGTPIVAAVTASAGQIIYTLPISFRYLRLRIATTITGGSIQAFSKLSQESFTPGIFQVAQATAANLNATIAQLAAAAAMADGQANPTTSPEAALASNFNGSTWDRVRNNANVTADASAAKTVTVAGATQTNFNARGACITLIFGAVTGTAPTLAVQLQWSPDGGTTWINYGPALFAATQPASGNTWTALVYPTNASDDTSQTLAAFTTGATATKLLNAPLPRTWRLNYTVAGTTPSITFAAYVNYLA